MIVPRNPVNHIVAISEVLENREFVIVVLVHILRICSKVRDSISFEVIEEARRRDCAFAGISCRIDSVFLGCCRSFKWGKEVERNGSSDGKIARRGVVIRRVTVDMCTVVEDRHIRILGIGGFRHTVDFFKECRFRACIQGSLGEVDAREILGVCRFRMGAKRPGTVQVSVGGVRKLHFELEAARNADRSLQGNRQIIPTACRVELSGSIRK